MALRYPQGCPMENVDPMVGPVARPEKGQTKMSWPKGFALGRPLSWPWGALGPGHLETLSKTQPWVWPHTTVSPHKT